MSKRLAKLDKAAQFDCLTFDGNMKAVLAVKV